MDNLLQMGCVVIGVSVGAVGGYRYGGPAFGLMGSLLGALGFLVISGAVLGIIRGRNTR